MLTSCIRQLDYTFSNPAAACPSLSHHLAAPGDSSCHPLQPAAWFGSLLKGHHHPNKDKPLQASTLDTAMDKTLLILYPKRRVQDPEDDLKALLRNEHKLRRCGYYHGSLSWADASHMLKRCEVGTYLVRDSEHSHYLYALSVQTRKGPTSCRLDYDRGFFRLDSAEHLVDKMPRFECVTDLVEHYVELTEYLSRKNSKNVRAPVWLDLDEENTRDAPVQICKPLYKQVPDLQLLCCQNIVRRIRKRYASSTLSRTTVESDEEYKNLPAILKEYLNEYLFPALYL